MNYILYPVGLTMMIKITAARRTALHAAVLLCVYSFFIFNHAFKLLPYVALAFAESVLFFGNNEVKIRQSKKRDSP